MAMQLKMMAAIFSQVKYFRFILFAVEFAEESPEDGEVPFTGEGRMIWRTSIFSLLETIPYSSKRS
jgi:hypothetical protein